MSRAELPLHRTLLPTASHVHLCYGRASAELEPLRGPLTASQCLSMEEECRSETESGVRWSTLSAIYLVDQNVHNLPQKTHILDYGPCRIANLRRVPCQPFPPERWEGAGSEGSTNLIIVLLTHSLSHALDFGFPSDQAIMALAMRAQQSIQHSPLSPFA